MAFIWMAEALNLACPHWACWPNGYPVEFLNVLAHGSISIKIRQENFGPFDEFLQAG